MGAFSQFEDICRAMSGAAFYPHPVSRVERIDTHISTVFLTGERVYKLKKPVDFGFLNFTDLNERLRFCEREVALNRRLSRGVYEGVSPILRDKAGRYFLESAENGEIVEYAVRMRQLPEEAALDNLLKRGMVSESDMEALGVHLAAFYERSDRSPEIDAYGEPRTIEFNMEENFTQTAPFAGAFPDEERWDFIQAVNRTFFKDHGELFKRRIREKHICDGHGDLRSEHIYFLDGIQIIDCIEFNDRFRYGDSIVDLAFLHMDLESRGHSSLSRAMLAAYVDRADDSQLYALIDFYAAYRSVVKLKVACLHSTETEDPETLSKLRETIGEQLQRAYCYSLRFGRPTLWVFCGLPATGKSSLASAVADVFAIPVFQSDRVRKELSGLPEGQESVVAFGEGLYRREMRNRVYAHLLGLAQEKLRKGVSVIIDGTFSTRKWREEAARLAEDLDANLLFVECVCDHATIEERLKRREETGGISDARPRHLPKMLESYEPLEETAADTHIRVDTGEAFPKALHELLSKSYELKTAQVDKIV